jgi:hypothetical protein
LRPVRSPRLVDSRGVTRQAARIRGKRRQGSTDTRALKEPSPGEEETSENHFQAGQPDRVRCANPVKQSRLQFSNRGANEQRNLIKEFGGRCILQLSDTRSPCRLRHRFPVGHANDAEYRRARRKQVWLKDPVLVLSYDSPEGKSLVRVPGFSKRRKTDAHRPSHLRAWPRLLACVPIGPHNVDRQEHDGSYHLDTILERSRLIGGNGNEVYLGSVNTGSASAFAARGS